MASLPSYFNVCYPEAPGGRLQTFDNGTTTPRQAWQDAAASVTHALPTAGNPATGILLDADGRVPGGGLFLSGTYTIHVYNAAGTLVHSANNVMGIEDAAAASVATLTAQLAAKTAGNGAQRIGFDWALIPAAIDRADWGIHTATEGYNVLREILPGFWAQIYAGTYTTDVSSAIQAALDTGHRRIVIPANVTLSFDQITMATDEQELVIYGVLKPLTALQKAIIVTGDRCRITGRGRIESPATFNGANARTTYATIWAEDVVGFHVSGIHLKNIPRCGVWLEDSTQAEIRGVLFEGNYPYGAYNELSTTGHCAIGYNPPDDALGLTHSLVVQGNRINGCIQGLLYGNFDAAGNTKGIIFSGNLAWDCWDHMVYCTLGEGTVITGNFAINCRRPIVVDGYGCVVTSNVMLATGTSQTNHEQMISVRNAQHSTVANNFVKGVGAHIDISCVGAGTDVSYNCVHNNTLIPTAVNSYLKPSIRIGDFSTTCVGNEVTDNLIQSAVTAGEPVISLTCTSGTGEDNTISGNWLLIDADATGIQIVNQLGTDVENNVVRRAYTAASAKTVVDVLVSNSDKTHIQGNNHHYRSGGANVTVYAVQILSTANYTVVEGERCDFTAASLVAGTGLVDASSTTQQRRNQWKLTDPMEGSFTLSGAASIVVTNGNVTSASKIMAIPTNNAAGACMRDKGLTVVAGTGSVTFQTSDGTNPAASSNFTYIIH